MSWANKRRRTVQKLVTFTPDEWERGNSLHKKVNKYTTRYRSFTVFARKMLTDGEMHITAEQVAELRASFDRIERLLGDLFANKRTAGKDV